MDTPEATYWEFFRADRAKDATAWAAVNSYPHVRVAAPGGVDYFATARDYASHASWTEREATGWVRTLGIEPERLHASGNRVHLAGGWTRYNADDEPILANRVVYVLTFAGGSWGIQARFACGAAPAWQAADDRGPLDTVERYLAAIGDGDFARAAGFARFPLVALGEGSVRQYAGNACFAEALAAMPTGADATGNDRTDARTVQCGRVGANVAVLSHSPSGAATHSLFLVARHGSGWRIAATSIDTL